VGLGVEELDTSHRAWVAIRRIFAKLDGCPKGNDGGRHKNLRNSAWELACLVADCELTEAVARDAYAEAAKNIKNQDGRYDDKKVQAILDSAFNK
jgi:hypothetical protein